MQRTPSPTLLPSRWTQRRKCLSHLAHQLRGLEPRRIVIAGGPRSGKSTFAAALSEFYKVKVHGTDELKSLAWSDSSEEASRWLDRPGHWIAEGVVMPRALRKFLAREAERSPADLVIWLNTAVDARVAGQEAMAKGCLTVFNEILPVLVQRGVHVLTP